MTRRALVLGAATGELTGVGHDVTTMRQILGDRGFEVRELTGAAATRDGILGAYEQLIQDTVAGDAAFVYYSGHGGSARSPEPGTARFPFIVPTDFDSSGPADFRGILATELSVLLARLLQRSPDATVMLDCCHAAHMSRDPALRPRALKRVTYLDVEVHRQRQLAAGLDVSLLDPLGNRAAVRLVACPPDASAYEFPNDDGVTCGIFTDAFRVALGEAGELPVTWATLMARIRGRVLALAPEQRPEVEGDESSRLLFGTERAEPAAAVPITGGAGGGASSRPPRCSASAWVTRSRSCRPAPPWWTRPRCSRPPPWTGWPAPPRRPPSGCARGSTGCRSVPWPSRSAWRRPAARSGCTATRPCSPRCAPSWRRRRWSGPPNRATAPCSPRSKRPPPAWCCTTRPGRSPGPPRPTRTACAGFSPTWAACPGRRRCAPCGPTPSPPWTHRSPWSGAGWSTGSRSRRQAPAS